MGRVSYTFKKALADAAAGGTTFPPIQPPAEDGVTITAADYARGARGAFAAPDAPVTEDDIALVAAADERKQLAAAADEEKFKHLERGEVFVARAIDPHELRLMTITSSWIPVTPSLCTEVGKYGGACGYDAAVRCGFKKGWDSIREDMVVPRTGKPARKHVLEKLQEHKSLMHAGSSPSHIRTREEAIAARTVRALPEEFIENPRLD